MTNTVRLFRRVCLLALLALVGCSQDDLIRKFSSPEDESTAKSYIDHLRARNFEAIEKAAGPSMRNESLRATLTRMADLIPNQEPTSIKLVGAHAAHELGTTTVSTTFEYGFGDKWLLANVIVQKKNGANAILGFNINPIPESLESMNRFTLLGKNAVQYLVLVAAVSAVLITLYALILCAKTTFPRRKWLWIVFILLGFGKVAVNWTTGEWDIAPLSLQLLSASAVAPLYGPWIIGVSLPLGALMFLFYKRPRLALGTES